MNESRKTLAAIRAEASEWISRRDRGFEPGEESRFECWRSDDWRHVEVLAQVEGAWGMLDRPRSNGLEDFRLHMRTAARRQRRRRLVRAASILTAVCLLLALWPRQSVAPPLVAAVTTTAEVLEPDRRTLSDGSIIECNADARIEIAFEPAVRRVRLLGGDVYFDVAKDVGRPFVVEAGGVAVSAVGTAFAVRVDAGAVDVLVTEGKVAVGRAVEIGDSTPDPGGRPNTALVGAGDRIVVPIAAGAIEILIPTTTTPAERDHRLGWRVPRLKFSDTTIAEAIALFNEHNTRQLRLEDAVVEALRVSGAFRADNVEGFVRSLQITSGIEFQLRGEAEIILRKAP